MFSKASRLAGITVALMTLVTAAVPVYDVPRATGATSDAVDPGSVGIRLVDIPADAAEDPRAHQYIVDSLLPGTTITRRIEVSNSTLEPVHVSTYASAATIEAGSFVGAEGRTDNDVSTWTALSTGELDLQGGAAAEDTVTIAVPMDAAPGESYAVVWAEVSTSKNAGVQLVNRVGIRVYLNVRGQNPPKTSFTVDSMTAARGPRGNPVVLAEVHNTGGRALDLTGTLSLTSVAGSLTAGPYDAKLGTTVGPGQSAPITIEPSDELTDGPWVAVLELRSGLLTVTSQAQITFPATPGETPAAPARASGDGDTVVAVAIMIASTVLLLLAAGIVILSSRRRRRLAGRSRG